MCNSNQETAFTEADLNNIRRKIPMFLSENRISHVFSVEKEARKLSDIYLPLYGMQNRLNDVLSAALLHDITKNKSTEEQLLLYQKYGIELSYEETNSPAVFHSRTGAYVAKEHFPINNCIFDAIYYHTLGKEDMTIFEKIIYLADFIEPERTQKDCVALRNYFYDSFKTTNKQSKEALVLLLDKTLIRSFDCTISYLIKENRIIHPEAVKARNFLVLNTSM